MKMTRLLLLVLLVSEAASAIAADVVNGIAVLVNDSIITQQDLQLRIMPALINLGNQFNAGPATPERMASFDEKRAQVEREGLEQLIDQKLVLSEYKTKGYSLPESYINDEVDRRIHEEYRTRVEFIKTLKERGASFESFRKRVREDFIYSAMKYQNVVRDQIVSPAKIVKYYEANKSDYHVEDQIKLRMIVLNRPQTDDGGATRRRAEEILIKLKEGADFAQMAKLYSEGSQSAQGGDWGWIERTTLRKELSDLAFRLQPGHLSDVIERPEGYYIMLVEEAKPEHIKPLTEVRREIEQILQNQEQAKLEKAWLARLKSKAFIRYFPF